MSKVLHQSEFARFFKSSWVKVTDLQALAKGSGLGASFAQALAKADRNGDGKISGEAEGRALFRALDDLDHDGSTRTISVPKKTSASWLQGVERSARPTSEGGWRPRVSTRLAGGDTLSPVSSPGSTLVNGQQLNRRYIGSGPVEMVTRGGRAAAVQFTGGMQVDTDGGTSALARSDRYYQSQTSMKWAGGRSLNSDRIPYVVLPPSLVKATGAKLGDLVQVTKGGKTLYAVFGDVGPNMKLGEGSLMLAKSFDRRAGPNVGIEDGVSYTVLPGSGARQGIRNGGAEKTAAEIQQAGAAEFDKARTDGIVR